MWMVTTGASIHEVAFWLRERKRGRAVKAAATAAVMMRVVDQSVNTATDYLIGCM